MGMGENIKNLREIKGLTQEELGKMLDVKASAIQKYEKGYVENIPRNKIQRMAEIFGVKPSYLMGFEEKEQSNVRGILSSKVYNVPVYESVSAGLGAYADNNIIGYEPVYIDNPSDVNDIICVIVSGDSMQPLINDGDRLVVRRQTSVDSGDIAVVMIDGEEALVKKVVYTKSTIELRSENPRYAPRLFEDEKVLRVKVLGKVLSAIRKF